VFQNLLLEVKKEKGRLGWVGRISVYVVTVGVQRYSVHNIVST
jgi:hypothetical protein